MSKGNLPEPFGIDKSYFNCCFSRPSLRHFEVIRTRAGKERVQDISNWNRPDAFGP